MKYLSPTSLSEYLKSPQEFYLHRLAENRRPRDPQTKPMSVGSAFDAYVKHYIHELLIGSTKGTEYDRETMFLEQVEEHNRDFAREAGEVCFNAYKESGALAAICQELRRGRDGTIKMEKTIIGEVKDERSGDSCGAVLLGKPDLSFISPSGITFVLDWKVNGYCSKSNVSPKPGYVICRDGWSGTASRGNNSPHKNTVLGSVDGIYVNMGCYLENIDASWARQVATYSWLLGAPVGSDIYCGIDQLACGKPNAQGVPSIRVASFRMPISRQFQFETYEAYCELWKICHDPERFCDHCGLNKTILDKQYEIKNDMDAALVAYF